MASIAAMTLSASAASPVIVTPSERQGWSTLFTTAGGTVDTVEDATSLGDATLQLSTDATTAAKATIYAC